MIATRVPRELLTNMGKHWGGYVIAVRSFHGAIAVARLFAWQVSTPAHKGRTRRPPSCPDPARPFGRIVPPALALRVRGIRQSFDAFGNDPAELHHLLAQSCVFHNFAMDAVAVRMQFLTQVP